MDILRRELNQLYDSQHLELESLDRSVVDSCKEQVATLGGVSGACYVITDASADVCVVDAGSFAYMLGISDSPNFYGEFNSCDEDIIYNRIHPEDLVEKRMLEYDFFSYVDKFDSVQKLQYVACCRLRIRNRNGDYIYVNNTTRIMRTSPRGKIWLILCTYELSPQQQAGADISAAIVNSHTGRVRRLQLVERRDKVLSLREKQILNLIREGLASKQIADRLQISIHTVNRHRQNILAKLSVSNSYEAIMAASAMRLF